MFWNDSEDGLTVAANRAHSHYRYVPEEGKVALE